MVEPTPETPARAREAARVTEHLFRHEAGKLVSILTRMFGIDRLQLAEDVVQEALIRAMQTWPYYGVPDNPAAWITQTAKHLALDILRREQNFRKKEPRIIAVMDPSANGAAQESDVVFDTEIGDERLRMMFACCHPILAPDARVALALKTLCGLGTSEIAAAFLVSEAAIAKRLTRARKTIREAGVPFEIPHGDALDERLESVEQTLYLLFNEGYKASSGDQLLREDLCGEAIRLVSLLAEHTVADRPRTHALAALMMLNAARFPERVGGDGQLLRLQDQDRSKWDRSLIAQGMFHLTRAASGDELSPYHIQAGIAACHCAAPEYARTNWRQILALYDQWVARDPSPLVALNRAVALANVDGPEAGKCDVEMIARSKQLDGYYLYHAVLGEFEWRLNQPHRAAEQFQWALERTSVEAEQQFLMRRLRECRAAATPA